MEGVILLYWQRTSSNKQLFRWFKEVKRDEMTRLSFVGIEMIDEERVAKTRCLMVSFEAPSRSGGGSNAVWHTTPS